MSIDELAQLADERAVPAENQIRIDAILERRKPQLVEPVDLYLRERLVSEIGECRAAPERESGAKSLGRRMGIAGREELLALSRRRSKRAASS